MLIGVMRLISPLAIQQIRMLSNSNLVLKEMFSPDLPIFFESVQRAHTFE